MKFRNQMAEFFMLNRMFTTNKGFGSPGRQVLSSIVLDNVADVGFGCGHFVSVTTLGDTCKSKKKKPEMLSRHSLPQMINEVTAEFHTF